MEHNKSIKDIGKLQGKVLVFGGVYSNLQALEALQEAAIAHDVAPDHIICTGDIVGYCAQPEACIEAVRKWGIHTIAGNVELQLAEGLADCGCEFKSGSRCDTFSRQWYPYAQSKLSPASIAWIKEIPEFIQFQLAGMKGRVLHGTVDETAGYIFASTPWEIKQQNFKDSDAQLILAGHCGLPFYQHQNDLHWLNAGVIGMPANDGNPAVWYLILEESTTGIFSFSYHRLSYDYEKAAALMAKNNLPSAYANTLKTGIWDNCEILPPTETQQQGQEIIL